MIFFQPNVVNRFNDLIAPDKSSFNPDRLRVLVQLIVVLLLGVSVIPAQTQELRRDLDFKTVIVFGDSLSDTGNVADLSEAKYGVRIPGPYADYTDGRFTDGVDTEPAAKNYSGVWIEQLAATFPSRPAIRASLDGGTDYAYGFAFTGNGTSAFTFGPSDSLSVSVNNIGQQITDYLDTKPTITDKTLFVVWGGANDLLNATSEDQVIDAGVQETVDIQRLIDAGAKHIIVPNLPPLRLVPRLNGSGATSVAATDAAQLYNFVLADGLKFLRDIYDRRHVELAELDVFALFDKIVAEPQRFGLSNVTDSSQGMAVDPDTYLFWDGLHPTTHGHDLLAEEAAKALTDAHRRGEEEALFRASLGSEEYQMMN